MRKNEKYYWGKQYARWLSAQANDATRQVDGIRLLHLFHSTDIQTAKSVSSHGLTVGINKLQLIIIGNPFSYKPCRSQTYDLSM